MTETTLTPIPATEQAPLELDLHAVHAAFVTNPKHRVLEAWEEVSLAQIIHAGIAAEKQLKAARKRDASTLAYDAALQAAAKRGAIAHETFYLANLRLAYLQIPRVKAVSIRRVENEELEAESRAILAQKIPLFDPSRGYKFSTFASGAIFRDLRNWADQYGGAITIPRHSLVSMRSFDNKCASGMGPEQAAIEVGYGDSTVEAIMESKKAMLRPAPLSYDHSLLEDGTPYIESLLPPDRVPEVDSQTEKIEARLGVTGIYQILKDYAEQPRPPRKRPPNAQKMFSMLVARFAYDMQVKDIAEQHGVSRAHVTTTINRTLEIIRGSLPDVNATIRATSARPLANSTPPTA